VETVGAEKEIPFLRPQSLPLVSRIRISSQLGRQGHNHHQPVWVRNNLPPEKSWLDRLPAGANTKSQPAKQRVQPEKE